MEYENGTDSVLPESIWSTAYPGDSAISYPLGGGVTAYPITWDRSNSSSVLPYSLEPSTTTFTFSGIRVQWLGCTGPTYGKATVLLDGSIVANIDCSVTNVTGLRVDPAVGFCDQVLFDSGVIPFGKHTLQIRNLGQPGRSNGTSVAVLAFSYVDGVNQCHTASQGYKPVSGLGALSPAGGSSQAPSPMPTPIQSPLQGLSPGINQLSGSHPAVG